jgi:uncharacterized metal-binding protein YceD (DUF177 family)
MNEFSRTVRIDTLGAGQRRVEIQADEAERAALAKRFGIPAIHCLSAEALVSRNGEAVRAEGILRATVTQSCVATDAPVENEIEESFGIEFRPHPADAAPDEEVELSEEDLDTVFYAGAALDLGEAVAETLSLALDPWPRAPGAEEALREAGVKSEAEAGPFGALAALRDKMRGE